MKAKLRVLSQPVFFGLELTPVCNQRCPGCSNVFFTDKTTRRLVPHQAPPLSLSDWKTVIDIIAPYAHSLRITGGEPILHPDFEAILQYVQAKRLRHILFTNGCWLDPPRLLNFLSQQSHLSGLLISLHGATSESHEAFTQTPGSFRQVVENIRRAANAEVPVTVSTVLTRANKHEISQIIRLSKTLGAQLTVFARYLGPEFPLALSPEELIKVMQEIDVLIAKEEPVRFGTCIPQCLVPNNHSTGCYAGVAYCTIDPWGNMRPCNHANLQAGNLFERPLKDIWSGSEMDLFRQTIAEPCHTCAAFAHCHGGCRAMILELGADPLITQAVANLQAPVHPPLKLHPNWHPQIRADIREQPWGFVLIQNSKLVPVNYAAKAFLEILDGTWTLEEINMRFGVRSLSLIGLLFQNQMIDFS